MPRNKKDASQTEAQVEAPNEVTATTPKRARKTTAAKEKTVATPSQTPLSAPETKEKTAAKRPARSRVAKTETSTVSASPATAQEPAAKPSRRKTAIVPKAEPTSAPADAAQDKPKRTTARKPKAVDAPAPEPVVAAIEQPKPKRGQRSAQKTAHADAPAPESETEHKPSSRFRQRRPANTPEPVVTTPEPQTKSESESDHKPGSRFRQRRPAKSPEPVVAPEAQTTTPDDSQERPGRLFRQRRPAKAQEAAVEPATATSDDSQQRPGTRFRQRRSERPSEPTAETPARTPEAPAAEVDSQSSRRRRARRRKPAGEPQPQPVSTEPRPITNIDLSEYGDDLPVPVWRTRTQTDAPEQAPQARTEAESSADGSPQLAPRRARTRKRKDRKEIEITAAAALNAEPTETRTEPELHREDRTGRRDDRKRRDNRQQQPRERQKEVTEPRQQREKRKPTPAPEVKQPEPEPPVILKPAIPVPEDAPQVVLKDGVPILVRNKRVYPPIFFFGSAMDESRLSTLLNEVRMAADNGIHVFSLLVELEVDPERVNDAVGFAGFLLKKIATIDPEGQVILRTVFTAPGGWEKRFPKAKYISHAGGLAEPSLCDDEFWAQAESCLKVFVEKTLLVDTDKRVIGIHLERGEWFFAEGWGYDRSVAAHEKFREWLRLRYRNDVVTLRAAWYDGSTQFDTVAVPEYKNGGGGTAEEFVLTGRKARRWVDYHLFMSDITVDRIADLAYAVKSASEGRLLAGVSYGYTFEWSHPANGHLSLGKLLRCRELDYIAGPPSYKNREPGGAAAFPCPIDSFALNGKLYISEEDFKTPISGRQEPDDFNPIMRTPQALESVHWRGAGAALAHSAGVCWMDSWGNGWLNSAGIWARGKTVRDALAWRLDCPQTPPDVAMFIDERSLAYLADTRAFALLVQSVREAMLRSGLSVGFYLLSDLAHREQFPESKLYVFVNAWDMRPEVRSAIKTRLQRDDKVLFWLYSAGLFEGGREALERVREVTGIALRPQPFYSKPGTSLLHHRHPLCEALPEKSLASGNRLDPSYFAIPEDGYVLGEYSQTGLPSFVVRHFEPDGEKEHKWTSVFLGEPVVTPALFRALGQMAGAHVWNYHSDVVHVRAPFLTVHCTGAGPRTITLPNKWSAYDLIGDEWAVVDGNSIRFNALDGATHVFLVGMKGDLDAIIANRPHDKIILDAIPVQPDNTLRWDQVLFEVPIMQLDEWVEEAWSEDLADDLLIKPSMLDVDIEESASEADRSNRNRRRRKKRRPGQGGSEEPESSRREGADTQSDDAGINVMFRRRE